MIHPHSFFDFRVYYILICSVLFCAFHIHKLLHPSDTFTNNITDWVFIFTYGSFLIAYAKEISVPTLSTLLYWFGILGYLLGYICFGLIHTSIHTDQLGIVGGLLFAFGSICLMVTAILPKLSSKVKPLPTYNKIDYSLLFVGASLILLGSICMLKNMFNKSMLLFIAGRFVFIASAAYAVYRSQTSRNEDAEGFMLLTSRSSLSDSNQAL